MTALSESRYGKMRDCWNENQCLNPLTFRYLHCRRTKCPWTYGLAVDSCDPHAHAADVPGESNSRRAEDMRRKRDDAGLLAIPFLHRGLTYNEFSGPSLDLGRTRSLPPNDRRRQAHWYQQSLNGLSRRHYAQCFWQQLITVKPIQMHDNRYGREMVGYSAGFEPALPAISNLNLNLTTIMRKFLHR